MIVGAETLIEKKEVACLAGEKVLRKLGLVIVTIAAAFSTGSAINATLFSTSRFMESVAEKKDLPHNSLKKIILTSHIMLYSQFQDLLVF